MRSNMRRAFAAFTPEQCDRPSTETKRSAFRSILFGLCFYHSLLLGRKKFGVGIGTGSGSGLGFCRGYSFNMGDLTTCGDVLFNYLEAYEEIPWPDLRYMFGEVRGTACCLAGTASCWYCLLLPRSPSAAELGAAAPARCRSLKP